MFTAQDYFVAKRRKQAKGEDLWHHSVYVIELDAKVLKDRRFRKANPLYKEGLSCFYVGCTGMSPDMRFLNHQRGYKSNRYAHKFGLRLRPDLYACYNPMPYNAAAEMEVELAEALREQGYGVWQH